MSITVLCSSCGSKLKAADSAAGHKTRCPKCGMSLIVPAAEAVSVTPASVAKVAASPPTAIPYSPPAPVIAEVVKQSAAADSKDCPFCGEQVLAVAKKCKHCGETIDVALRAAEEARRAAVNQGQTPMVFMNAGGGGGAAVSDDHAWAGIVEAEPRPRRRRASGGVAAMLELFFGLFFGTFGIGHIYGGHVAFGLFVMFGAWFVLGVNVALIFLGIGFLTLPLCWIAMLIISPLIAASSCR